MSGIEAMKAAAESAKNAIAEMYQGAGVTGIGLEEIAPDETNQLWLVTIGYNPAFDDIPPRRVPARWADDFRNHYFGDRRFKVVTIRQNDGSIVAIKDRFMDEAPA